MRFDEEPIASIHSNTKKELKASNKSSAKKTRQSLTAFDVSDAETTPKRALRQRTDRQRQPYQAEKLEHKHASQGKKLTEADLARELKRTRSPTVKPSSRKRRSTSSRRSVASVSSLPNSINTAYTNIDITMATVRTHFSELQGAGQTLPLTAKSAEELIGQIEQQWQFKLGDRTVKHCTVSLPWKTENSNLLLMRNMMGNTFDTILEEVRRAPTWRDGDICFIDIELFV